MEARPGLGRGVAGRAVEEHANEVAHCRAARALGCPCDVLFHIHVPPFILSVQAECDDLRLKVDGRWRPATPLQVAASRGAWGLEGALRASVTEPDELAPKLYDARWRDEEWDDDPHQDYDYGDDDDEWKDDVDEDGYIIY